MTSSVQPAGSSGYSMSAPSATGSASLAQDLEQVFTALAGAVTSAGGQNSGSGLASEASNPIVGAIAQVLGTAIDQISGQSVNLLSFLQPGGGGGGGGGGGDGVQSFLQQPSGSAGAGSTVGAAPGAGGGGSAGGAGGASPSQPAGITSLTSGTLSSLSGATGVEASASGNGGLTETALFGMISTALAQNGDPSQNDLSGPQNIQYWDPNTATGKQNLDSFYSGVVAAHNQFFPSVPMSSFAMAVVAEAGAESTLNPTAGGGGLLQVTPADAVTDYNDHGTPITDASGKTVLTPGQAWDPNNPETNVLMWAWYNKNCVAESGVAPNNWGKSQSNGISNTYGNIFANWLGGPGDPLGSGTDYYVNRIQRFYEKLGGTDFNTLLNTPLTPGAVDVVGSGTTQTS